MQWATDIGGNNIVFTSPAKVVGMSQHAAGANRKSNMYHAHIGDGYSLVLDLALKMPAGGASGLHGGQLAVRRR